MLRSILCLYKISIPVQQSPAAALGQYTRGEEIANAVTHGIAAALSMLGLGCLLHSAIVMAGTVEAVVSAAVFGSAMIVLYLISTLYHAIPNLRAKRVLQVMDHSAIFLLIAGTYTPFCLMTLSGRGGEILCAVVWGVALIGVLFQPILIKRAEWLNCVLYLALGWCVVTRLGPLIEALPTAGLWLLVSGGVVYSLGVIFYLWERVPFNHAIWHLFVLVGTTLQFFAVLFYVIPV